MRRSNVVIMVIVALVSGVGGLSLIAWWAYDAIEARRGPAADQPTAGPGLSPETVRGDR
jgi:hypothetical protein